MADLNVQRKKKSILPWVLLVAGVIALVFFLGRGYVSDNIKDDTVLEKDSSENNTVIASNDWETVNYNAPSANYQEIVNKDIEVRDDDNYAIYTLVENSLFDADKGALKQDAAQNLQQIAQSIEQRYPKSEIRVYGFTGDNASKENSMQLGKERAASVESWLIKNGNIADSRISTHTMGDSNPAAGNSANDERQQGRSVEIVVKHS